MKTKIILFVLAITLYSCEAPICKYRVGDIVYLKPDSTKAVIIATPDRIADCYTVTTGYKAGMFANNIQSVYEEQIYTP